MHQRTLYFHSVVDLLTEFLNGDTVVEYDLLYPVHQCSFDGDVGAGSCFGCDRSDFLQAP